MFGFKRDKKQINQLNKQKQQQNRPYKCACGKGYLSAPALYTHVKIKHGGVAPGPLTKPANPPQTNAKKRQRRPGRTATFPNAIQQDSDCQMNVSQQASKLVNGVKTRYTEQYIKSDGEETCQDMGTKFLTQIASIQPHQIQIITCFLNCLKQYINSHFQQNFWQKNSPDKIVIIANQFIRDFNTEDSNIWPLQKAVVIDLLYLLCKWMYRRKWTTNKLIKRNPPNVLII